MLRDSKVRPETSLLGSAGERAVGDWLHKQGFAILCYNFRSRAGEVDLIAQRNKLFCFVEVKVRTTIILTAPAL